ncbi:MAG TPA: chorismate-binding protein, partial [Cyclobacteriaceae bacterium]|nr:chorismate-binding protein [Cyclobacteriaceae bacterium]
TTIMQEGDDVVSGLQVFMQNLQMDKDLKSKYPACGLFGYMAYDTVRYFEDISIEVKDDSLPDIYYQFFRYVIVVDHFSNEMFLFEHLLPGQPSELDSLQQIIQSNRIPQYPFKEVIKEQSNLSDAEFMESVRKGISHCKRGDVFQLVLSRRFTSAFRGDEFNVYRALRSINPSPYLFYFDFGSFKLFGSSPEAQIKIQDSKASIYPIAGTFRRTGSDEEDAAIAKRLSADEKENAEHIMLVDLARNDLSRHARNVEVEVFREIQYYSHVIHLVSTVSGELPSQKSALRIVADTFPAGTLSGAPKHMAMQLINRYENINRQFYGGAIGFIGFNGSFNHAIMIRTFLSKHNQLICQAGAGIVAKSVPENELQEVNNKLEALRKAIKMAEKI